ncbi:hypothetical protein [Infirmifilum sp.]|uniref:hypothetical protein n=1 Tax=Infirmifilum sp. TaxID=2856575 RepID=UPI003D118974
MGESVGRLHRALWLSVAVYVATALLDSTSTYLCLSLIPTAYETNIYVASMLWTPLHPLIELFTIFLFATFVATFSAISSKLDRKTTELASRVMIIAIAVASIARAYGFANNLYILLTVKH